MASASKGYSAKQSRISVGGSCAACGYGTQTHNFYVCWKLFKHRWKGKSDLAASWLTTHDSALTHGKQYLLWASFICFVEMKYWTHLNLSVPVETALPFLLMVAARAKLVVWGFVLLFPHSQPCGLQNNLCLRICRAVGNGVLYYPLEACFLKATLCSRFVCSDVKLVPCVNRRYMVLSPPTPNPQNTVMYF